MQRWEDEKRPEDEEKKLGHSNLDVSSKVICSERRVEQEENKELKSISAKDGMA